MSLKRKYLITGSFLPGSVTALGAGASPENRSLDTITYKSDLLNLVDANSYNFDYIDIQRSASGRKSVYIKDDIRIRVPRAHLPLPQGVG
jgi:hypothetical protein